MSTCRINARSRRWRSPSCCATIFAGKGVLDKTEITYTYPIGRLHALEPVAKWTVPEFDRFGIKSETFFNTKSVDPKAKTITSEEGSTLNYDLLITIPPHTGSR